MSNRRGWLAVVTLAALTGVGLAAETKLTFEMYPDAKDEYRWRLKGANGKVIATS